MEKTRILQQMNDNYLVAVVRGNSSEDAILKSEKIIEGGILNIEITFTTPYAELAIKALTKKFNKEVVIGAGTVLDAVTARIAIMNGARYVVSPHFDVQVAHICHLYQIPYLPACSSVTEITNALQHGVEVVKLFPGNLLGAKFIRDVHGPLPQAKMMPSGGISLENMEQWYNNGAFAIGIGSALTRNVKEGEEDIIVAQTREFVQKFQSIRHK
ncbi:bifunctional 2-keto-4-hydroxyglutarate aldolase/2-keto-3-deoxy-6-phosphogluconate aldolase [Staphylococcus nepalensis]|uniref:bifunctional 2-keto-4-hydroxyglutarate aldolase/2-keto-3-deoxy-6-phosphogluconate aldolase n=1 Tax=Staphylococcus nepalensis TaxID=214473 RepID=UPI003F4965CE